MARSIPKFINNQSEKQYPSSGEIIISVIKKRKINRAALARNMQRSYSTVSFYLKNGSIQTSILWELSLILKHNFFADIAHQLPADLQREAMKQWKPKMQRLPL